MSGEKETQRYFALRFSDESLKSVSVNRTCYFVNEGSLGPVCKLEPQK